MAGTTLRRGDPSLERTWIFAALALAAVASFAGVMGPESMVTAVVGFVGVVVIAMRPQWGVAVILTFLMVQYGSRRAEREGIAGVINTLIPAGEGLFTLNNVLGVYLALVLVYRVYRDGDWSFLRSRQVRLVALITLVLIVSNQMNHVDYREQAELGLRIKGQDPMRLMASRGLFLLLFAAFVRAPRDLRLMVGIYVFLALLTAWSGTSAAMTGGGRQEVAEYRAGGLDVLLEAGQNPNRLALLCTLALVFIWEHGLANPLRRYRWLSVSGIVLLVLTIFLSASRGGVVGLAFAAALLFVRRRQSARGWVYAAVAVLIGSMLISQLVPPEAFERLTNIPGLSEDTSGEGGGSIERRTYTYGVALDMWSSAPVFGVGLGNWSFVRFSTDPLRSSASAHNSYLKALAEGGLVTLTLYLLLFYVTNRELARTLRDPVTMARAERDGVAWVISATRVCLLTFMVFSLFADLWDLIFFYLLFGLAAAILGRYGLSDRVPAPQVALRPA